MSGFRALPIALSRQQGTTAVEFAVVAILFFTLLFSLIEFARFFYVWNTVQEVTRRAARIAVVSAPALPGSASYQAMQRMALFGMDVLGAEPSLTKEKVLIEYLDQSGLPVANSQASQLIECPGGSNCIRFVRASVSGVTYRPIIGVLPMLNMTVPASASQVPAESLGYVPPT